MGYTHYYGLEAPATNEEVDSALPLIEDTAEQHKKLIKVAFPDERVRGELFYRERSRSPYEDFYINLYDAEVRRRFCKTARRPYDLAVCEMLLILAAKISVFKIASDGFCDDYRRCPSGSLGLEENWPVAIQQVKNRYGIDYTAGYCDLGNTFVFDVRVEDRSVLDKTCGTRAEVSARRSKRKVRLLSAVGDFAADRQSK
jgi:hypothetical protein